jgi:hypothetical protein
MIATKPLIASTTRPSPATGRGPSAGAKPFNRLWVIAVPILLLCLLALTVPRISGHERLAASVYGASGSLLIFSFFLRRSAARAGRTLRCEIVLNRVHYVQLTMQSCVYAYWGWYARDVYHFVPLIVAQIAFAYGLDMLVCWSRRDNWILGFGPVPIILSTNLFLWFRDDWFFLQFLMIATGVLAKEFIKWRREGRLTHIFNPSAIALFLFSIVLLATKTTGITRGEWIASTLHNPPHIYLEIFLLGLVVQSLFRVTLVTLWAAVALYVLNVSYTGMTGDYNFLDSNIPVSVFLGLHLLVTDPATSPRKSLGKIIFGASYGACVFGLCALLGAFGAPQFYDKLLCVPLLNLTVRRLDRFSEAVAVRLRSMLSFRAWSAKGEGAPRQTETNSLRHSGGALDTEPVLRALLGNAKGANFAWMAVWASFFAFMLGSGFLSKGEDHPGGSLAHWQQACEEGRYNGCKTWVRILNLTCQQGSSASCFTLGQVLNEGRWTPRNVSKAGISFAHACDLGLTEACSRLILFAQQNGENPFLDACNNGDGASCFILGSLANTGNGIPKDQGLAFRMFSKSCDNGWWRGCGQLGASYLSGQGTAIDPAKAMESFEKGCRGRNAPSCLAAANLYNRGVGAARDQALAGQRLKEACELGLKRACR